MNTSALIVVVVIVFAACTLSLAQSTRPRPGKFWVYVGTYTGPDSKGIHLAELDAESGDLQYRGLAAEIANPTFLAVHPNAQFLYAAGEQYGPVGGAITAFAINHQTGLLTQTSQIHSGGKGPCHLAIDLTGHCLLTANYGSGSFQSMPVEADGSIKKAATIIQHTGKGPDPKRQASPHAHGIYPDPTNRYAVAVDLGIDQTIAYEMDAQTATLTTTPAAIAHSAPGAGPRHLAFSPDGNFVYVTNELNSTVDVFAWKRPGFEKLQTISTLPEQFEEANTTAEIAVHPTGKTLYVSNRGHDSIATFSRDPDTGLLTLIGHTASEGDEPRHFGIDPTGHWMLVGNQKGNNLVLLAIGENGELKSTGKQLPISAAVCAVFVAR